MPPLRHPSLGQGRESSYGLCCTVYALSSKFGLKNDLIEAINESCHWGLVTDKSHTPECYSFFVLFVPQILHEKEQHRELFCNYLQATQKKVLGKVRMGLHLVHTVILLLGVGRWNS